MISQLLGDKQLGVYKIGVSFSVLVMPLIGVFSFIYLSKLKEKLNNDSIKLIKKSFHNQIKINFWISFIFVIFCLIFLNLIIEFIYDIKEKNSYYVGVIMSIGVVFNVVSMVFSYTFLAIKRDKEILIITLIGAIVNIILNYFFITSYGILGAALASLITQFLLLILFIYVFYFKIHFFKTLKNHI
jgi:O-antigen/teichoic acid export membrane protein